MNELSWHEPEKRTPREASVERAVKVVRQWEQSSPLIITGTEHLAYWEQAARPRLIDAIADVLEAQRERIADMVDTMAERPYDNEPEFSVCINIAQAIREQP